MHTVRFAENQGRLVFCPRTHQLGAEQVNFAGDVDMISYGRTTPFRTDSLNGLDTIDAARNAELLYSAFIEQDWYGARD